MILRAILSALFIAALVSVILMWRAPKGGDE